MYQDSNGKWAKFGCKALSKGYTTRRQYEEGKIGNPLTVNGSLRRSVCANALDGNKGQTKDTWDLWNTNWEFIRKCGSASSDDNRSREASSHVGQYGVSNGHDAEHVGFELTDDSLDSGNKRGVVGS